MVGEAVTDKAQTTLLDVLLDGVESLLLGDLQLGVRPARNLDDHVEDAIVGIGEKRDIVEGRDDGVVVLLDEHTVFWTKSGESLFLSEIIWGDVPRVLAAPIWRVVYSDELAGQHDDDDIKDSEETDETWI